MITTDIGKKIEGTIVSTSNNAIPNIIGNIVCELKRTFNTMTEEAVKKAKKEIDNVGRDIEFVDTKKERCEAEKLETYNRRDNVKTLGLREDLNENGQPLGENLHQTIEKVLELTNTLETCVDVKDTSIAHLLPSRKGQVKPIIVKFLRRVAKIDVFERRKFCSKKEVIFEFSKT